MSASLARGFPEPDPPAGVVIRPLAGTDTPGLGALMFEAFAGTVDDDGGPLEDHVEVARRTLAGQFGPVIPAASRVAANPGPGPDLLGAVVVTRWSGRPMVAFALVQPAWQRRGLGAALLARSANALQASGETRWILSVTRHNPARLLYERYGFTEVRSPATGPGAAT